MLLTCRAIIGKWEVYKIITAFMPLLNHIGTYSFGIILMLKKKIKGLFVMKKYRFISGLFFLSLDPGVSIKTFELLCCSL